MARRVSFSRLNSTGCFPTKIRLFISTVRTSRSSSDRMAFAFACGRLTSTPWVSIGAVTMKMMRSTSITSVRGTMLISDINRRSLPFPLANAIGLHLLQVALEEVHELDGETVEARPDRPYPVQEEVVCHDRWDRGGQPGRGRDQRLGDTGGDRGERGAAGLGDARKGVHDPPDGAEQADEGRRASRRRQKGEVRLHERDLLVGRLPHRPLHVVQGEYAAAAARRRGLGGPAPLDPHQLEISRPEHLGERGPLHFLRLIVEVGEVLPLGEGLGEFRLALFDPFEKPEFEKDDRPGDDRERDEHQENELHDRPGEPDVLEHLGVEQAVCGRCYGETHSRIGHRRGYLQGNYILFIYPNPCWYSIFLTFPRSKNTMAMSWRR